MYGLDGMEKGGAEEGLCTVGSFLLRHLVIHIVLVVFCVNFDGH
jgi:hypothetical protein